MSEHMHSYSFNRSYDDPITGQVVAQDVNTTLRGYDVTITDLLSGMQNFLTSCDYELNGSGVGLVAPAE